MAQFPGQKAQVFKYLHFLMVWRNATAEGPFIPGRRRWAGQDDGLPTYLQRFFGVHSLGRWHRMRQVRLQARSRCYKQAGPGTRMMNHPGMFTPGFQQ